MKVLNIILMSVGGVVALVILAVSIYHIIIYRRNNPVLIPKQMDAKQAHRFSKRHLRLSDYNGGLEYSFNFWMYISNLDYRYADEKIIMFWKGKYVEPPAVKCKHKQLPDTTISKDSITKEIKESCPFCQDTSPLGKETFQNYNRPPGDRTGKYSGIVIAIAPKVNDLIVRQSLLNGHQDTLRVSKIPIQKWLHIVTILKQRHLDVFVNGELITSIHLTSIPTYRSASLSVTPNGGFDGFISRVQYHNRALTIQDVRHHFNQGPPTDLELHVASDTGSRIMEDVGYQQ